MLRLLLIDTLEQKSNNKLKYNVLIGSDLIAIKSCSIALDFLLEKKKLEKPFEISTQAVSVILTK